jgi:hypothetical protein
MKKELKQKYIDMSLRQVADTYIRSFAKCDLGKIKSLLAKNVVLVDWENNISGIDDIISFTKSIHDNHKIGIIYPTVYVDQMSRKAFVCFKIKVDDEKTFSVIDKIGFDKNNRINFIEAYKL